MVFRLPRLPRDVPLVNRLGHAELDLQRWWQAVVNSVETNENAIVSVHDEVNASTGEASASIERLSALLDKEPSSIDSTVLEAKLRGLELSPPDPAIIEARLQGLELSPPGQQFKASRYGSFYDTTTQTAAAANTAYAVTFDTDMMSFGAWRGTPTSRVYVDTPGVYNVQYSIHPIETSGAAHNLWAWLRKNGTDIAYSLTHSIIQANGAENLAERHMIELAANDYLEAMWAVDNTAIQIQPDAASAFYPAGPCARFSITDNIALLGV